MDSATMGDQEATDRGDGVGGDLNHARYSDLIIRFWRNARLTAAEMKELDELHLRNIDHVWAATAAKEEVEK
jgi:hypothetical protein